MPDCVYCAGEIHKYDSVHFTPRGVVHDECLYDFLRESCRRAESPGGRCIFCGEELSREDETIEFDGDLLHGDCLFGFVRRAVFPVDYI